MPRTRRAIFCLLIFLFALAIRLFHLWQTPTVDPDAIRFVDLAHNLLIDPLAAIRAEPYHPLHSLIAIAIHPLIAPFTSNDRIGWLLSLQLPAILAGSLLTLQIVSLARTLGSPFWPAALAALAWSINYHISNYGPDALSDSLALSLFAASIQFGLRAIRANSAAPTPWAQCAGIPNKRAKPCRNSLIFFFLAGLLSGLAYLARPEGLFAVILLTIFLLSKIAASPRRHAVVSLTLLLLGALIAAPYALAIGTFTHKKQILTADFSVSQKPRTLYAAAAATLRESRRALGIGPLILLTSAIPIARTRLLGKKKFLPLILPWLFLWPLITSWLYMNSGYLDPRHTLILQLLLHLLLARALFAWSLLLMRDRNRKLILAVLTTITLMPSLVMLPQSPRASTQYLRTAAAWIDNKTPPNTIVYDRTRLVGYYANRGYPPFPDESQIPEHEPSQPVIIAVLHFEGFGRVAILDPALGPYKTITSFPAPNQKRLILYGSYEPVPSSSFRH